MDDSQRKNVALPDITPESELKRTGARRTVVLGSLITIVLVFSSGSPSLLPRLCVWYRLTGTDCPFCGLTRSVVASGDFQLARAVELHPLGPVVLGALIAWLVVSALRWGTGWPPALPRRFQKLLFIAFSAAWLAWWVAERLL